MHRRIGYFFITILGITCAPFFALAAVPSDTTGTQASYAADMLNRFGVNTHIDFGWIASYTNQTQTAADINYLGNGLIKILRDSPSNPNDLTWWPQMAAATHAKFLAYIGEGCGAVNSALGCTSTVYNDYLPTMQNMAKSGSNYILGFEGGNEEDDSYPVSLGNSQYLAAKFQPTV